MGGGALTRRVWLVAVSLTAFVAIGGYAFYRCCSEMLTADTLFAATHQSSRVR